MTDRSKNVEEVLATGTRIEEFVIERALQSGGFGVTYLAGDRSLGRRVAIKEYLPREWGARRADGSVGPRSSSHEKDYRWGLARFLDEARTLARLDHARIVRVHRVIEAWGTAYMVMEYVEGRNLEEALRAEGPWPESRVRALLEELLPGVELVHEAGLVHRDIKPANVMLRADGTPVLIDFGAARYAAGVHSRSLTSVLTPGYAPHEQYHQTAGKQGPWTDVYALGAVAYRALSGRKPVEAPARVESAARKQADPLAPVSQAAAGGVSAGFGAAVTAALALWPEGRPRDVAAWRAQWDAGAAPAPTPVRAPSPERPVPPPPQDERATTLRPWLAAALAALVLAAGVAGGLLIGQRAAPSSGGRVADLSPEAGLPAGEDDVTRRAAAEEAAEAERLAELRRPGRVFRDCDACPEMVVIPAGEFQMGSPASEEGREDDEGPQHRVTVRSFALGVTEVTFDEWEACVRADGCGGYRPGDVGWGRGARPVINVSWEDARAYVRWLSRAAGESYRLPSEAEWEYAARGGTTTSRYWGDSSSSQCGHANGVDAAAERVILYLSVAACDDGAVRTAPVGSYSANAFDLFDVLGNVWEWTEECWHENYRGAPADGSPWRGGDCGRRVLRGGSWDDSPRRLRSAARYRDSPGSRSGSAGFRVAKTLD